MSTLRKSKIHLRLEIEDTYISASSLAFNNGRRNFHFHEGGNVASEKRRQSGNGKAYQVCSGVEGDGGGSGKNGALRRIVTAYYLHG